MSRIVNALFLAMTVAMAVILYQVKYESGRIEARIAEIGRKTAVERDAIAILRAEWSHLNRPERLARLAGRYLDLKPVKAHQIVTLRDLPERPRERNPYGPFGQRLGGYAGGIASSRIY